MSKLPKNFIDCSRVCQIGLLVGVVFCLSFLSVIPAAAQPPQEEASSQLSSEAERAAYLINQQRMNAGLPPLAIHPLITLAANQHIIDMVTSGRYGHGGSDGSTVGLRISRTGYRIDGWAGENWAVYETVDKSVTWWMNDPPHRANVLNPSYKEMGIGTRIHPRGWGLILVADFTTGNSSGQSEIVIAPAPAQAVPAPAQAVPAPIIRESAPVDGANYTIQAGDTLSSIGARYGLSWQAIASANGLGEFSMLSLGSQIVIPGAGQASVVQREIISTDEEQVYTVVDGDTVYKIALRYGVNWQTLSAYNNLPENALLSIGRQLKIPGAYTGVPETVTQSAAAPRVHVVAEGETLWSIAAKYSVDWYDLVDVNHFNDDSVLSIGQSIRLP